MTSEPAWRGLRSLVIHCLTAATSIGLSSVPNGQSGRRVHRKTTGLARSTARERAAKPVTKTGSETGVLASVSGLGLGRFRKSLRGSQLPLCKIDP